MVCKQQKIQEEISAKVDKTKLYSLKEAVDLFKEVATAESTGMEMHIRLNVDPRHADQQVRSTVCPPSRSRESRREFSL